MLIGEYVHTLDDKKRLSLPAKFRKELGSTVILTRGLDRCVFLYPLPRWQTISDKMSEQSFGKADQRYINRFFFSAAMDVQVDKAGRILVPDVLKDFADLKAKIVIAGVGDRLELWNSKVWEEHKKHIEKDADMLAEKLGEIGML